MCLTAGLGPLVVSAWGSLNGLMISGPTPKDKQWLRRLSRDSAALLVENPNLQEALARLAKPALRVRCFPIGVDGNLFHPGYAEEAEAWRFVLDIPANATVLLSPRGWSQLYGQHDIMRAFAKATRRLDSPLVLVLLGMGRKRRPEVYAQEVLDLGASLGVAHAIRWIPQIPHKDMPGVYALADIVVNYPSSDAFPSTLLEAAACARPVISSHLPAYRNTFVERSFKLVQSGDPDALANAIVELAGTDSALWRVKALDTRKLVLDEYDEVVQKERLMSLYDEVIHRQSG
jgi:glycosyltransferase involved in cell wall biosynthesis